MTDLGRRLCITLTALALYRIGIHIPLPGVDSELYRAILDENRLLIQYFPWGWADAFRSISIFAFGIAPYLIAAVTVRLASLVFTGLREMEEGSARKRSRIVVGTRLLALLLVALQGHGMALGLEWFSDHSSGIVPNPGAAFRMVAVATLIGGMVAIMWLADQITQRGLGNGVALILFADIAADLPRTLAAFAELTWTGAIPFGILVGLIGLLVLLVALMAVVERAVPHAVVTFPSQEFGGRVFAARQASIPLKLVNGGLVSAVLAMWLFSMVFYLVTLLAFGDGGYVIEGWVDWAWYGHPARLAVSVILIIAMTYLYSLVVIRPRKAAEFLESKGAGLSDTKPGTDTERALRGKLARLAMIGGGFLALVYLMPEILQRSLPLLPGSIGGAGLLIAVAVALDTLREGAHRLHRSNDGDAQGDVLAILKGPDDRDRISAAGR